MFNNASLGNIEPMSSNHQPGAAHQKKGREPMALFLVKVIKWLNHRTMIEGNFLAAARLLRQLGVPVRVANKLGPALVPGRVLRVNGVPLGMLWRGK